MAHEKARHQPPKKSRSAVVLKLYHNLMARVERFGYARTSLVVTIAVVMAVIVGRYYYSFVTGFILPDEAWYYDTYILENQPIGDYREVFTAFFKLFFQGTDVWQFLLKGFIYSTLWSVGTVLVGYKTIRRLEPSDRVAGLIILSLPMFPVFIVLAPTILTEPMGLFFAILGIYLTLRFIQGGSAWNAVLSGVSLVFAFKVREPYLVLGCGFVLLYLILPVLERKMHSLRGLLGYAVAIAYIFPVPLQLHPLQFAQPGTQIYQNLASWLISHTSSHTVTSNPGSSIISSIVNPIVNPPISISAGYPAPIEHPDVLQGIVIGLGYGFNPLFAVFAVASLAVTVYLTAKTRSLTPLMLFFSVFWALGSFVASIMFTIASLPGALTGWTSTIVRASHTALPAFVGLGPVYTRIKPKRVAALMLIVLVIGSTQLTNVADAFQKSLSRLPVNRLTLDYRAPAYRLYLLAKGSGKTLVVGGLEYRTIRMFMAMLPNVQLVPVPSSELAFKALLNQSWQAIYLYDDWVTVAVPEMIGSYPAYYAQILQSKSYMGYSIEKVWVDGESYALRLTMTTSPSSAPQGDSSGPADPSILSCAQTSTPLSKPDAARASAIYHRPILMLQPHVLPETILTERSFDNMHYLP
jgi:hypothetical protein